MGLMDVTFDVRDKTKGFVGACKREGPGVGPATNDAGA
jgi:hypothetical protein